MNKLGAVLIVIGVMIACYLFLLVVMPVITGIISTANATVSAQTWANHPGSQGFLQSTPWIMFFVPGTIGIIVIVMILRKP